MSHLEKYGSVAKDAPGRGTPFYLGGILINPGRNLIDHPDGRREIQPKLMSVLCYLCERAGQVVSADDLIDACWPDQYVSDSPIHKAINQLRGILQDTARDSKYIKTIARKGYTVVAKVEGLERVRSSTDPFWARGCPFPGPWPFRQNEGDIFHGRGQITTDISEWLLARALETPPPLTSGNNSRQSNSITLHGPAGGGKTSLVQAGVVPAFFAKLSPQHAEANPWRHCDLAADAERPAYKVLLEFLTDEEMADDAAEADLDQLLGALGDEPEVTTEVASEVGAFLRQRITNPPRRHKVVICIDHLELALQSNDRDRTVFALLLDRLAAADNYILLTIVQDHALPQFANMVEAWDTGYKIRLPALSHSEITDVIQKPADAAGLIFERHSESRERLDTLLIHEQRTRPVALAILQSVLAGLYASKKDSTLTYTGYEKLGGIEGCLAAAAEEAFSQLPKAAQASLYRHLFGFIELNAAGDTMTLAAPVPLATFDENTQQNLIMPLLGAGVFTSSIVSGASHICLAHESLLSCWPRLRKWLSANATRFYLQHDVAIAAERWVQHDRNRAFLLMDRRTVKAAEALINEEDVRVSSDARAFIERSAHGVSIRNAVRLSVASVLTAMVISLGWLTQSLQERTEQLETSISSAQNLVSAVLYDFKEKLEPLGKLELLEAVGAKAKDYFDQSGTRNLSPQSLVQWTESLNIMGQVHADKLEYDKAQALFEKSKQALDEALAENADNIGLLKQAMLTNYWLGLVHFRRHEFEAAQPFIQAYLSGTEELIGRQPDNADWHLEKSYALTNLGALAEKTGGFRQAATYLSQSAAIKRGLVDADPDNHKLRDGLANTLSWQASVTEMSGSLTEALHLHSEALKQGEALLDAEPSNFRWIRRKAILGHSLARIQYDMGHLEQSLSVSLDTYNHLKTLVKNDPENDRDNGRLVFNLLLLSRLMRQQNRHDEGLAYISEASVVSERPELNGNAYVNASLVLEQARLFLALHQNRTALTTTERGIATVLSAPPAKTRLQVILAKLLLTKTHILRALDAPLAGQFLSQIRASREEIWKLASRQAGTPEYKALYLAMSRVCCNTSAQQTRVVQQHPDYKNPDMMQGTTMPRKRKIPHTAYIENRGENQ